MESSLKKCIQREVFEKCDERIIKCLTVTSCGKRKRRSHLCATISYLYPVTPRLHEVVFNDKTREYHLLNSWLLAEIKVVDGVNPRKLVADLEIIADQPYRWETCQLSEKDAFVRHLWKMCHRYRLSPKPEFVNISIPVEEIMASEVVATEESASVETGSATADNNDDFHTISAVEQSEFRKLLSKYDCSIANVSDFINKLMKELVVLDEANMQTIVGSERQIAELLNHIDQLLTESGKIEQLLDEYDTILLHVKNGVEMMEEKDMLLLTYSNNRERLKTELKNFISSTKLGKQAKSALLECDLSDPKRIVECSRAAFDLQKCVQAPVSFGLTKMRAYEECMQQYALLTEKFSERFVAHLSSIFRSSIEDTSVADKLPNREITYGLLRPFSDLMFWIKSTVPDGYLMLIKRYIQVTRQFYSTEIGQFMAHLESLVAKKVRSCVVGADSRAGKEETKQSKSGNVWMNAEDGHGSHVPPLSTEVTKSFFELVNKAFGQLEQCVLQEDKFCAWFFHLTDVGVKLSTSTENLAIDSTQRTMDNVGKKFLSQIFDCLDNIFQRFFDFCEQQNSLLLVHLLSTLSNRPSPSDSGSHSSSSAITGKLIVLLKRRFDAWMEKQISMLTIEPSMKKIKYEILWTLPRFYLLAKELETAYANRQRRSDLDRWYTQLMGCLWRGIETAAEDPNSKSPTAVVRIENYHALYSMLSQLKISCLGDMRRETKAKYSEALEIYVESLINEAMAKLKTFFDGISHCIEQGMTPEEISYQQAYSRQEMKRVIANYQLANVKREVGTLYNTIESQLSNEKHLLQVVWRDAQDCFIRKYKRYSALIELCYANCNVRFEFTVDEILQCFSAIALEH